MNFEGLSSHYVGQPNLELVRIAKIYLNQMMVFLSPILCYSSELDEGIYLFTFFFVQLNHLLCLGKDVIKIPTPVFIIAYQVLALAPALCQSPATPAELLKEQFLLVQPKHEAFALLCLN